MLLFFILLFFLSFFLSLLSLLFGFNFFLSKEMNNSFECGYEYLVNSRMPFSLRFYMVILIFLVFDMELILLVPFIVYFYMDELFFIVLSSSFVMLIILLGFLYEWLEGCLDWV